MNELKSTLTALGTSLMRAIHTRLDPEPLINDPWGDQLVAEDAREVFRKRAIERLGASYVAGPNEHSDAILDLSIPRNAAYPEVIVRTRFTEDALHRAVISGVTQYVIIGAGFDSFVLRRPEFARSVVVYEIDQSRTQASKLKRFAECGLTPMDPVHFVAANFNEENLPTALARAPFKSGDKTFFSWLGVTMYLSREVNLSALRSIVSCAPPGSELVFTYFDEKAIFSDAVSEPFRSLRNWVSRIGEPWLSGFDPGNLADDLHQVGLDLIEDLDGNQMLERYGRDGSYGWSLDGLFHIAHARIAG
ncbi:MAG: class I SAM-dependent methyltransferase [Rhodocyclaceae bacterium]|nr:MAG: class I SAM-dependent methyltransferase [Rhodocyclaceae bacterium]